MRAHSDFNLIVVGAGHAGCEAALASARAGLNTLLLTINLDLAAALSCNPSIGGQGKAQLVREVDALGGIMGIIADETRLQTRKLNTRKGMAVQANRFQSDKDEYCIKMLSVLLSQKNLTLLQAVVSELIIDKRKVIGVKTLAGDTFTADATILTTGTFLRGLIHIGMTQYQAGRAGEPASNELALSLKDCGLPIKRFKTGTPPRINKYTINFSKTEEQTHDPSTPLFSLWSDKSLNRPAVSCHITRTTELTHSIIKNNFHKSALMSGQISGIGPRYCPSIEDKVNKFPDKSTHKIFLEPEGANSSEIYLQGMATSLPEDVQHLFVKSIPGLENAQITRAGYAIEYDIVDPSDLYPTMMSKSFANLFLAGQINGTSGYEEAAAQGILAAINAIALLKNLQPLILPAHSSYTGLMARDITEHQIDEPYRVFTSSSPFRLSLRMTNAEERLSHVAHKYGILENNRYEQILERLNSHADILNKLENYQISFNHIESLLSKVAIEPFNGTTTLYQLLKRPNISLDLFCTLINELSSLDKIDLMEIETKIKYAGYIVQQQKEYELRETLKDQQITEKFFDEIPLVVSFEARKNILAVRPKTLEQLSEIPGVRASDFAAILMKIKNDNKIIAKHK